MATNRFICEICNKGFQREQNLQLHRRGHNLPWKLKQRENNDQVRKKVYVCPEKSCVHHDPCRALGDLTGIKKHYSRKHGEKKWKCEKCSRKYAVQSDWKAHNKICGTREYKCDCGTLFSRKDSFITHRAFCDALTEESVRVPGALSNLRRDIHLINNSTTQVPRIPQIFPRFHSGLDGNSVSEPLEFNYANNSQLQCFPRKLSAFSSNVNSVACNNMPDLVETMNMFGSPPQQETQWLMNYRASFTSANNNNLSIPLPAQLPHGLKQEQEENKQDLSYITANSVYFNNQNSQGGGGGPTHMSAAISLLHKDNASSTFDNNNHNVFGMIGFSGKVNNNNTVEVQKFFKEGNLNHDQLVSLEDGSTNLGASGFSMNDSSSNNNKDQFGLTRDFLGVGDESITISRPFDLTEFNAIGSVMDLQSSHYGGHYC
ncbi:hypothetical protein TanjilG_23583 [Lupinus angustifolius]|uniref:C2H2-type domain-containing protein n=2 Tax=Lupinus angustifolius TaxID=3871 RepID=A0A4P1R9L2_LUPAN|nr:hypothetical protein TanjilG_23583 [Lupinus angustifolius]